MSASKDKKTAQLPKENLQKEERLKILSSVAFGIHLLSFVMFFVTILYFFCLIYRSSQFWDKNGYEQWKIFAEHVLLTKGNMQLVAVFFCGFMIERPSKWLYEMSEKPKEFFGKEGESVFRYTPITWLIVCSLVLMTVYGGLLFVGEKEKIFLWFLSASFPIFGWSFFVCLLCLGTIEYYKKLIVHKEN